MKPALALYQPDIPQNAGALMRLGACLGVAVHIVRPAGFRLDDRALRRAGMDYVERACLEVHADWPAFAAWSKSQNRRLVLLTTSGDTAHTAFAFDAADILLLGRESAGVPEAVHATADARLRVPMGSGMRSLNLALAGAMVLGEALRQTGTFPAGGD